MAFTYGTITNAKGGGGQTITAYQVRLGYELQSQDIENNTSSIKLQLEVRSTNSTYKTYGYNQTTTIDGTALASKTFDMRNTNVWQIFGTRTITVNHNNDGTYSVEKSGSFTTTATSSSSLKSGSASVLVTLPTIPRASEIGVPDANIGSTTNIAINKANDSFTTSLWYKATGQNDWTLIVDKTSLQVYAWTVPTSFYQLCPNSRTLTCEFKAQTYNDNSPIGDPTTTTAIFTANVYPTINSITTQTIDNLTETLTGDNTHQTAIKGVSGVQISVSATAGTGASIDHYVIDGESTSNSTKTLVKVEKNSFDISVYDTRGEPPTTQTKTLANTMVDYVPLTINGTVARNLPTDGIVNINVNGNYFNDTFGNETNALTVEYRKKESTDTWENNPNWTDITNDITITNNTYNGTNIQVSGIDYTKVYNFELRVKDKVYTSGITIEGLTIAKGVPIYWWDENGLYVEGDLKKGGTNVVTTSDIGNATITIQKNSTIVDSFTTNASTNKTINISVPTKMSDLTNDIQYSTSETIVGKWTDDSIIYRKVIDFGTLPSNANKNVSAGIGTDTVAEIITLRGIGKTSDGTFYPIPFAPYAGQFGNTVVAIRYSNVTDEITIGTSTSSMAQHTAIVIMEYTKS